MAQWNTIKALVNRGIDEKTAKELANKFTLDDVKKASIEELAEVLGEAKAAVVMKAMGGKTKKKSRN